MTYQSKSNMLLFSLHVDSDDCTKRVSQIHLKKLKYSEHIVNFLVQKLLSSTLIHPRFLPGRQKVLHARRLHRPSRAIAKNTHWYMIQTLKLQFLNISHLLTFRTEQLLSSTADACICFMYLCASRVLAREGLYTRVSRMCEPSSRRGDVLMCDKARKSPHRSRRSRFSTLSKVWRNDRRLKARFALFHFIRGLGFELN